MIEPAGPLAWLDTLLGARDERLEAEVAAALSRARRAEETKRAALLRQVVGEGEAAELRRELAQAQEACKASEAARRRAERENARIRRQAERTEDRLSSSVAAATADRTWDLVRVLEAALDECRREHGHA